METLQNSLQFEKSSSMADFLKEAKVAKGLRKNCQIDYPTVLQKNVIPVLKDKEAGPVIIQYTPPAGIKLTYLLPLLSKSIKEKRKVEKSGVAETEVERKVIVISCASKTR